MNQPKTALIDLHYLPSLEYFICLQEFDELIFDVHEHYIKQSYRNRFYILTANKVASLSVPVIGGNKKRAVKDIKIDYQQKWVNNHWRALASAYGKAPFFEYYADYFLAVFERKPKFLVDLNLEFLSVCLNFLNTKINWKLSEKYSLETEAPIQDLRSAIHPKKSFKTRQYYKPQSYPQLFGNKFVANLSVLDLLFCEGPNAANVLQQSSLKMNKTNQQL